MGIFYLRKNAEINELLGIFSPRLLRVFDLLEVTSQAKEYPVESALVSGEMRGWHAADSGTQAIRLIFDEPQKFTRISLVFEESETAHPEFEARKPTGRRGSRSAGNRIRRMPTRCWRPLHTA